MDTVYDTTVVAYSNGQLAGRRRGNALDRRLCVLEEFIVGVRLAWYNAVLLREYEKQITICRNDVIEAFLARLGDHGKRVKRSTLPRQAYARAREIRWPGHDQHLLMAALDGTNSTIFVTEEALARCSANVRREFGFKVVQV